MFGVMVTMVTAHLTLIIVCHHNSAQHGEERQCEAGEESGVSSQKHDLQRNSEQIKSKGFLFVKEREHMKNTFIGRLDPEEDRGEKVSQDDGDCEETRTRNAEEGRAGSY